MAAPAPSTLDILTSAARKLGAIGAGEASPSGEDTDLLLSVFNEIVEQKNLRERNCFFERTQAFPWASTKNSYSIGTVANAADFQVADGDRPFRIKFARIVLTSTSPATYVPCAVVNIEQYQQIATPQLVATGSPVTQLIYYQPTVPNGTLFPYPVPGDTSDQLELTWWNQLDTVAIADIATALSLPQGFRRGLALSAAVAAWLSFPKRTDLAELQRQEREVWADIQSVNVAPPKISTTDGIGVGGSTFDWRSRSWQ